MTEFLIWQDREFKVDVNKNELQLRKGEVQFDIMYQIENTKTGEEGTILFSNLRLLFIANKDIKSNLSIGYDCIGNFKEESLTSKVLLREVKGVKLICKSEGRACGVLFNSIKESEIPDIYKEISNILQIYKTTPLYRDVKLRSTLSKDRNLNFLVSEEKSVNFSNVLFFSPNGKGQANGQLFLTNVRIIWLSNNNDNFNVSIPWIQVKSIKNEKFENMSKVMAVEVSKYFGNKIYHFTTNNEKSFDDILDDCIKAQHFYQDDPILGIDLNKYLSLIEQKENKEKINNIPMGYTSNSNNNSNNKNNTTSKSNNNNSNNKNNTTSKSNNDSNNTSNKKNDAKENKKEKANDEKIKEKLKLTKKFNALIEGIKKSDDDDDYVDKNENENIYSLSIIGTKKNSSIADIVFCEELGLSIERLPENLNIEKVWKIIK